MRFIPVLDCCNIRIKNHVKLLDRAAEEYTQMKEAQKLNANLNRYAFFGTILDLTYLFFLRKRYQGLHENSIIEGYPKNKRMKNEILIQTFCKIHMLGMIKQRSISSF